LPEIDWTLDPVQEFEFSLLRRMLQLYFYDFSEIDHDDLDESGDFGIDGLERYGRETGFDAWILRVAGKPAGFALVDLHGTLPGYDDRHYIHEFQVLRAYRSRGLGTAMAWAIFDRYPGPWLIEQIGTNIGAQAFWRNVIDRYTGGRYTERTEQGRRFPLIFQEFDTKDRVIT
jgi:predicted acetyltransferase